MWSRVVQARCVCNCPSCLLTTNAIARRATTATARRTIRVGDVFTVSLSSLAAGLAFADSRKKDDRRKQWDRVIGEARATVEATEIQQLRRLAALSDDARVETQEMTEASTNDVTTGNVIKEVEAWDDQDSEATIQQVPVPDERMDNWLDVFDWAREQRKLREASGFQDWKGLPLSLLQTLSRDQLHELLTNERLLRRFYGGPDCNSLVDEQSRYPLSIKKLRTLEWSVAKLVYKLLLHCSRNSMYVDKDPESPTNALLRGLSKDEETIQRKTAHARQRLRILHAERRSRPYYEEFGSPQVPNYDDTTIEEYKQTTRMNKSLINLLDFMTQDTDVSDLMSKLCYNLLTARTPPNIHTYNLLLVRFCLLKKDDLVKAVLCSMRDAHIRPNEITHATLLRHFTATGNRLGFVKYWMRMEGSHRGLALANPEQIIHPLLKERYRVLGRNHHKVVEKGRMNGQVYESLIVGVLQFFGGQTAMRYYRDMISEGWSPGLGILLAILQDCCRRLDWTLGTAVLQQIEMSTERINSLTYEWTLRLCQCCGKMEFFDQILRNGVHCGALPASILDLPDHAKAEDVAFLIERAQALQPRKATGTLEKTAARISFRLGDTSPFLMENVLHACEDQDALRHTINRMNYRWKARLSLQTRLDSISTDIDQTVLQANHALNASKHLASVKLWLSRRVKHLEERLEQNANSAAYASFDNSVRHKKVQRNRARRAEDGEDESGNSMGMQIIAGFSKTEAEHVSRLPLGHRQREPVQWNPPSLPPLTDTSDGSFWKDSEEQMAATARRSLLCGSHSS